MHYSFSNKERYNPERLRQIDTQWEGLHWRSFHSVLRTLLQRQGALQLSVVDGLSSSASLLLSSFDLDLMTSISTETSLTLNIVLASSEGLASRGGKNSGEREGSQWRSFHSRC
jgi:hypothetical protein